VAPATSLGWPPAAPELSDPLGVVLELLALSELLAAPVLLALVAPPVPLLLAAGVDLLEEQPAASSAATARVAPVRTSDVRRDITEDHAPGGYSRHLRT